MSIDICCCRYIYVYSILLVTHVLLTSNAPLTKCGALLVTHVLLTSNAPLTKCCASGISDRSTAATGLFAGGGEESQVEDDRLADR